MIKYKYTKDCKIKLLIFKGNLIKHNLIKYNISLVNVLIDYKKFSLEWPALK